MRLTDQECADIAITAAEGGIGYWSQITTPYDPVDTADWNGGRRAVYYAIAPIKADESGYDYGNQHVVSAETIRRGVRRMRAAGHRFEVEDCDALDADAVIQYALLGQLVYG